MVPWTRLVTFGHHGESGGRNRYDEREPAMRDSQWGEIEAIVKYMCSRAQEDPAEVERLMPHLRRVVEKMPRRRAGGGAGRWEGSYEIPGFVRGTDGRREQQEVQIRAAPAPRRGPAEPEVQHPLCRATRGSAREAPPVSKNQDALAGKASWFVDPLVRG